MARQLYVIKFFLYILKLFSYIKNNLLFSKKISENFISTEKFLSFDNSFISSLEENKMKIYNNDKKIYVDENITSLSNDNKEDCDYFFYDIEC